MHNAGDPSSKIQHAFPPVQSACASPEVSVTTAVLIFDLDAHHLASLFTTQCYLSRILVKMLGVAIHFKK